MSNTDSKVSVRKYCDNDIDKLIEIWNEVVEDGMAFPQSEPLTEESGREFFASQTFTGAAVCDGEIVGLYILHPNNVGRCSHQSNASFAVKKGLRGRGIGEALVSHALSQAKEEGYRLMIFNAVVSGNEPAMKLYEKLGFVKLGTVPGGFLSKDGSYIDTNLYYRVL